MIEMIGQFLKLEWKSFTRSSMFNYNMAVKIILGIIAAFYLMVFLMMGFLAYYGMEEEGYEPLITVNQYIIFWWLSDLVFRYFLQKMPVMKVKPLLTQPITRKTIIHYLLSKSIVSFFNIYSLFFFLPFAITLIIEGYSWIGVLGWYLAMRGLVYLNNFLNIAINNKNKVFIFVAIVLGILALLQYYNFFDITAWTTPIFQAFYDYPWLCIFILGIAYYLYKYNYSYYLRSLYLDDEVQVHSAIEDQREFSWLDRFGLVGTLLKNDIRMILRNKRPKLTALSSFLFIGYGLFFLNEPSEAFLVMIALIVSGGFLFNFGNYVPSWDSSYYPLLMSQSVHYKQYLFSKWILMVLGTVISMVIAIFYAFLNQKLYLLILALGVFNIGFNSYITLLSGAYTKVYIDLSAGLKMFGEKQAFNVTNLILIIPKLVFPIIIYIIFRFVYDENAAFIALAVIGLIGIVLFKPAFYVLEKVYNEEKYDAIQAFKQK